MIDEPYVGPCYGRTEGIAHYQSFTQVQCLRNTFLNVVIIALCNEQIMPSANSVSVAIGSFW